MLKIKYSIYLFSFIFFALACNAYRHLPASSIESSWKVQKIPSSPQTNTGNPEAGENYLIYGDLIGSGIPYDFFKEKVSNKTDTTLNRTGENAHVGFDNNIFEAANGVKVMTGNCYSCHAGYVNGELILGLGNSFADFRKNNTFQFRMIKFLVKRKFKKDSPEWEAFMPYADINIAALPYIVSPNPGVTPAFRLEEAYGNYRNPNDLTFDKEGNFDMIKYTLASDTPPLWNVKKKNALYYNAMGRGDFTKLLMQASTQGIKDSVAAKNIHNHFDDVLAYLETLEPPKYPWSIDENLAAKGKVLFKEHCSKCHGTYDETPSYPNKLVSLQVVKTDPYYAQYFNQKEGLASWYNQSWFAESEPKSELKPSLGYIAPPLDGIWATAPYLHNASIPTLDDLLNSSQRPIYWQRSWKSEDYDQKKLGWHYQTVEDAKGDYTYDTTLPGYGKEGHYFGDELNEEERKAVLEYLKKL